MKLSFLHFSLLISLAPLWVSCGQFEGRLERDYSFYVDSDSQGMTTSVVQLIQKFNQTFGKNIMSYEPNRGDAGSVIKLERGIKERDNKIGWANYRITRSINDGKTTGNVRLDYNFVQENSAGSQPNLKLETLLFHELGHVFGLGHTISGSPGDTKQVMWESINDETKDFDAHFFRLKQAYDKDSPEEVVYGSYE